MPRIFGGYKKRKIVIHWKKPTELLSEGEYIAFAYPERNGNISLQGGQILGLATDYSQFHVYFYINGDSVAWNVKAEEVIAIGIKGNNN